MLMAFGVVNAQKKCNGHVLKLKNGKIERYDESGTNMQMTIISNVLDFDCTDSEIAVIKTDGSVVFYSSGGNLKFSCGRDASKIKYLDNTTYVVTKKDGKMRKYQVGGCNDRGAF